MKKRASEVRCLEEAPMRNFWRRAPVAGVSGPVGGCRQRNAQSEELSGAVMPLILPLRQLLPA